MFKSSIQDIKLKLDQLVEIMKAKGYEVDNAFRAGLSRDEITEMTKHLPFTVPEEVYQLYTWRNGAVEDSHLFMFRDEQFISLEQAIEAYAMVQGPFGISDAFPFASFEGSFYVLPSEPFSFEKRFERPVVSVFEGIDVYFYSFSIMLDTQIEWIERGVHKPGGEYHSRDLELEIWKKHNPGIFEY